MFRIIDEETKVQWGTQLKSNAIAFVFNHYGSNSWWLEKRIWGHLQQLFLLLKKTSKFTLKEDSASSFIWNITWVLLSF